MKKARFNYWKLTALLAALAMSLVQGVGANRTPSRATTFDRPNLSSEAQTVNSFNDDLSNFDKKRVELTKKSTLTNQEFSSLERTGNDLKQRVSQLRDAAVAIINKLKAAGRWETLDEGVLAKLTDAKERAFVRDNGGLRHLLENAVADLNSQSGDEIVAPLSQLRAKVAQSRANQFDGYQEVPSRMVAASYEPPTYVPPAPLFRRSLRCIGASIRVGVDMVIRGVDEASSFPKNSNGAITKWDCRCNNDCAGQDPVN